MPKPHNEPAGESECPIKGCSERVPVFTYRASSASDEKRRRFAGRLYCVCGKHGRVENQEFLLEHITWVKGKAPAADATSANRSPAGSAGASATAGTRSTGATKLPAADALGQSARVRPPVKRPAAAPVPPQEKPKQSDGGGWLPDYFK